MKRPSPLFLVAGLGLCIAGCDGGGRDPAVGPVSLPPRSVGGGGFNPGGTNSASQDQAAILAACRRDADRIVTTRDRGQLMREDEAASRVGSQASIYSQRQETDRLGRQFERDRIATSCVEVNSRSPAAR